MNYKSEYFELVIYLYITNFCQKLFIILFLFYIFFSFHQCLFKLLQDVFVFPLPLCVAVHPYIHPQSPGIVSRLPSTKYPLGSSRFSRFRNFLLETRDHVGVISAALLTASQTAVLVKVFVTSSSTSGHILSMLVNKTAWGRPKIYDKENIYTRIQMYTYQVSRLS